MRYEPASWVPTALGEVLTERKESPSLEDLALGAVRVVSKIGFGDGKIQLREDTKTRTGMILVRPGDLVVSGINAAKGAIAIYDESNTEPIAATIHYGSYIPDKKRIDVRFLWWLLRSQVFRDILDENLPGGIKTELKAKRLLPIQIPLPPLDEQRRIVARIEQFAGKIEEAKGLRKQTAAQVDRVLGATSAGVFDSPKWPQKCIESLVGRRNLKNGKSVKSASGVSDVSCLRLSSMRGGQIDCRDCKPVPISRAEAKPYFVQKDDVFVMRGNGSKELVGRAGLIEEECPGVIFPDLFIRVPLNDSELLGSFFIAVWNSRPVRKIIEDIAKTTSGIWKINQGHIAAISIPVPPIEAQSRIVAFLDALQAKLNAVKKHQAESSVEIDALLPSILSKAFRGEL